MHYLIIIGVIFAVEFVSCGKLAVDPPRFLVLPGFFRGYKDYVNPFNRGEEYGLIGALKSRGLDVDHVPLKRTDWLNVFRSMTLQEFYTNSLTPEQMYSFYFEEVDAAIQRMVANDKNNKSPLVLIGHSAGGWLARAMLADGRWRSTGPHASADLVAGLVTLGSPHLPPIDGSFDLTRGALRHTHEKYPGAHLRSQNIFYVSVAGAAVEGNRRAGVGSVARFASDSYEKVSGLPVDDHGERIGDGITPLSHAHLEGAHQITLDCHHDVDSDAWYGSHGVIDKWLPSVLTEYEKTMIARKVNGSGESLLLERPLELQLPPYDSAIKQLEGEK
jgi:pimeloyl-ACP methyl ester carboxylesterase